jgi:D-xylose transport system substrate-binding protein
LIKDKKVVVTGMDTELSACRRIVEGSQAMTMYMPIKLQAGRAMEAAMLMLKKEEIPGITSFVDNGKMKVPAILLKPIKVDLENLEEVVIKDGFHKTEDVFGKSPIR